MTASAEATRVCSKCQQERPLDAQHFTPGRAYTAGFRPECRECRTAYLKARLHSNSILRTSLALQFEQRCIGCERVLPYTLEQFAQQLDAVSGMANTCRLCRRVRDSNSRVEKRYPQRGVVQVADVVAMLERDGMTCTYCGVDAAVSYELDHIVPLSKGGAHSIENLCLSCPHCNHAKWDGSVRDLEENTLRLAAHIRLKRELDALLFTTPAQLTPRQKVAF